MRKDLIRLQPPLPKTRPPLVVGPGVPRVPGRRKFSLFQDVSPGNVGNVFEIAPSETNDPPIRGYGNPTRVLEIQGDDELGETICVSIQQETIIERALFQGIVKFPEGPCVGIVEFGAGAGLSTFEFDIPGPTVAPGGFLIYQPFSSQVLQDVNLPVTRLNNGILLTLPASSMRVFVRNDARVNYLWSLFTTPPAPPPPPPPIPPNPAGFRILNSVNLLPAIIRVHATYGRRPTQAKLTRSYPICASSGNYTEAILAGQGFRLGIPPYAKKVFFPRRGSLSLTPIPPLQVDFVSLSLPGGFPSRGTITIPAGETGDIEVMPNDSVIDVVNPGSNSIEDLIVVFELAI